LIIITLDREKSSRINENSGNEKEADLPEDHNALAGTRPLTNPQLKQKKDQGGSHTASLAQKAVTPDTK